MELQRLRASMIIPKKKCNHITRTFLIKGFLFFPVKSPSDKHVTVAFFFGHFFKKMLSGDGILQFSKGLLRIKITDDR